MDYKISYSNGETGDYAKAYVKTIADNTLLNANDSGKTFLIGTDAKVVTLPLTQVGLKFTLVNIGASGNNIVKVSPKSTDGISGSAGSVVLDGTVNKAAINTKSTAKTGDSITILGTGLPGTKAWIVLSSTGVWAQES